MKKTTKTTKTAAVPAKVEPIIPAPAPARRSTKTAKVAAAPAAAAPKPSKVTITAKIDVGFGNALFARGDGAGLSWGLGTPLECLDNDTWTLVLYGVEKPFAFKLLLNDQAWSTNENFIAGPGDSVTVTPSF